MSKILLLETEDKKNVQILKEFFQNLSPLLNIKGFLTQELNGGRNLQVQLLSQKSVSFLLNLNDPIEKVKALLQDQIERLIFELSVFELVDIFLLDKLGMLESFSPRLRQQIITVFHSRIPVIATAHQQDVKKLDYLLEHIPVKILKLEEFSEQDLFSNLIRELYDL